jgi:hypothetical protein
MQRFSLVIDLNELLAVEPTLLSDLMESGIA